VKKIGEYTTRGTIRTDNSFNRIILDDGSFKTGYRIVEFVIAPSDIDLQTQRVFASKLLTDDTVPTLPTGWNWASQEEIAWASASIDANSGRDYNNFSQVDPDNLVIQDLFIVADEGLGTDVIMNYYIRMEKYEISDWQGALAMVRNKSQA